MIRCAHVQIASFQSRSLKKSSKAWIARQQSDPFVKARAGLRSRSAFKLLQVLETYPTFIRNGDIVFDLGSAPGGWSSIATQHVGSQQGRGKVIAVDLLHMDPIDGVDFIQGDFTTIAVQEQCKNFALVATASGNTGNAGKRIILSDMLGNVSGNQDQDHFKSMELCHSAFGFAKSVYEDSGNGGHFFCKYYQGKEDTELLRLLKMSFAHVKVMKPDASRKESREAYFLCRDWKV